MRGKILISLQRGTAAIAAAALLLLVLMTFNGHITYLVGWNLMEYALEALMLAVFAHVLLSVDWKRWGADWKCAVGQAAALLVAGVLFSSFVHTNLPQAAEAQIVTASAFAGESDDAIRESILEHKNYYHAESFVRRLLEVLPEDAAVLYFGDQRAHTLSYQLYPRRVYVLPALQEELNLTIQEGWDWMKITDPMRPPMRAETEGETAPKVDEGVRSAMRQLIAEKQIGWLVYYDSLHPERSFVEEIAVP